MAFDIRFDAVSRRLLVIRSGFWECPEVDRYRSAMATALAGVGATGGVVDVHINLTAAGVLAAGPAERMRPVAALLRDGPTRRVAWVTDSALSRMQVRRVVEDVQKFRMFATDREAVEWFEQRSVVEPDR